MTIVDMIQAAQKVIIVGHQRPDGDCLGSGFTFVHLCEKYGKKVDFLCDSPKPEHYAFMPRFEVLNDAKYNDYDLLITVDCADNFRLGKFSGYTKCKHSVNIDHHKTNNRFAEINIVEKDACSTCEIVYKLLEPLGEIDDKIAYWLFVGLSTDTGHFMHSNTTPEVLQIAANLCKRNIIIHEITSALYKSNTYNKTKLIARAIESMRFFADGRICIISISLQDFDACECTLEDTEGLIDYAIAIKSVEVAVCIAEQTRPQYKVSYRSKTIDVALSASTFGGGGHTKAAGCVISGKYEDVIPKIVKSITDGMDLC